MQRTESGFTNVQRIQVGQACNLSVRTGRMPIPRKSDAPQDRGHGFGTRIRLAPIASLALLVAIVGCPPEKRPMTPVTDDVPMETVVSRVNRNARGMNFLLRAGGVSATGKLARTDGKVESFDAHGTLFFRRPRNLYLELKHSLAGKIEIGSNDREFWYWERFEDDRYYTGEHARMSKPWESEVPLRADQLLEMLSLQELPLASGGAEGPVFKVAPEHYQLDFFDRDEAGRPFRVRSVEISRRPPFLVSAITYYNPDQRPWMKALMREYKPIEGTMVFAPRRIEVQSLTDESRMTLEFGNMRPSDNDKVERQRIARSPLERGEDDIGQVIRMDRMD